MNNPLLYTDPTGYKWDWNWLNPAHWLSEGMQWINDKTTGLRQTMTDIGVPDFNVGYSIDANLSGGGVPSTYHSAGGNALNGVNFVSGEEFYSRLPPAT